MAASFVATFGGAAFKPAVFAVAPTPRRTILQPVLTPAGVVLVFGVMTPVPWSRPLPIRSDATPWCNGPGVDMHRGRHATPPSCPARQTVPENRPSLSPDRADALVGAFLGLSGGTRVSDIADAPGVEIGRPDDADCRRRIEAGFGTIAGMVTDGHLTFTSGR